MMMANHAAMNRGLAIYSTPGWLITRRCGCVRRQGYRRLTRRASGGAFCLTACASTRRMRQHASLPLYKPKAQAISVRTETESEQAYPFGEGGGGHHTY